MPFPAVRMRRYRQNQALRDMFSLSKPAASKFIWPLFLVPGTGIRDEISSMPGQFRYSLDTLLPAVEQAMQQGINAVLLFGIVDNGEKDKYGSGACFDSGIVQRGIRELKKRFPRLLVFSDVCLCAYTDHGHCGPLFPNGSVDNDAANEMLVKVALSHAEAGVDCVAPSAMMDGQVQAIRSALDRNSFKKTLLMSYSTKFASSLYGPFRDAEQSEPGQGDRKGYQAPYGDLKQALRESQLDEEEGADILMVKPSLYYLDVLAKLRERTDLPIGAYNVSGEYSMIQAMAQNGWGDLYEMAAESLTAIQRAGSDLIISYWAPYYDKIFGRLD